MQYKQLLGHSVKTLGVHYVSHTSGINVQDIINGQEPRNNHIDKLRSMSLHMNYKVPQNLLYSKNQKLLEASELLDLQKQEDAIFQQIIHRFGSLKASKGNEIYTTYQTACIRHKTCYRKLHDTALATFRLGFFCNVGTEKIHRQLIDRSYDNEVKSEPALLLEFVSAIYSPGRFLVANLLYKPISPESETLPDRALLQAMIAICQPGKNIQYYPGEHPTADSCLSC